MVLCPSFFHGFPLAIVVASRRFSCGNCQFFAPKCDMKSGLLLAHLLGMMVTYSGEDRAKWCLSNKENHDLPQGKIVVVFFESESHPLLVDTLEIFGVPPQSFSVGI